MNQLRGRSLAILALSFALAAFSLTPVAARVDRRPVSVNAYLAGHSLSTFLAENESVAPSEVPSLRQDATARVDARGHLLFVDEKLPSRSPQPAASQVDVSIEGVDTADAFALHSDPTSTHKIFIDARGGTLVNSAWNNYYNGYIASIPYEPYDTDGNLANFSNSERQKIIEAWAAVAEDYAPFDVDVTTETPVWSDLVKSDAADDRFGYQAVVTTSNNYIGLDCGCGGISWVGVFNEVGNSDAFPAFAFAEPYYSGKDIADIISHEVGHALGLSHDGIYVSGQKVEYYDGRGAWAPIMGAGYSYPMDQWSNGDYSDSTNTEDDLSIISDYGLPRRADDYGNTIGTASTITAGITSGLITDRTDKDVFKFVHSGGAYSATVQSPAFLPNLDVQLELLNSSGTVLASDNPSTARTSDQVASNLSATVSSGNLAAGTYYLRVDGVGVLGSTGYSDYGSLGRYELTLSANVVSVPGAPTSVSAVAGKTTAAVSWSAPLSDGGSAITSYTVTSNPDGKTCSAASSPCTVTDLRGGISYTFTVKATSANGDSDASNPSGAVTVYDVPLAPTNVVAVAGNKQAAVSWGVAASRGKPVTKYIVTASSGASCNTDGTRSCTVTGLTNGQEYTFTVYAQSVAGDSAVSAPSAAVTPWLHATGVGLSKSSVFLSVGATEQLSATVSPEDATDQRLTWSTADSSVATVSSGGLVTAIGVGETTITVETVDGGAQDQLLVTVTQPVESVSLASATTTLRIFESAQLVAAVSPANASNQVVTWQSSAPGVVSVSSSGYLTANSAGQATITVTTMDGSFTDTVVVTVVVPTSSVVVGAHGGSLRVGTTLQLTAAISPSDATDKSLQWSTSASSVATVSSTGLVRALKAGTVVITVTNSGGQQDQATLTVLAPIAVKSVSLPLKVTVKAGKTTTLKATLSPTSATNKSVTWKSSNSKIATVTSAGVVKGLKVGKVTITVTSVDGKKTDTCIVTVIK